MQPMCMRRLGTEGVRGSEGRRRLRKVPPSRFMNPPAVPFIAARPLPSPRSGREGPRSLRLRRAMDLRTIEPSIHAPSEGPLEEEPATRGFGILGKEAVEEALFPPFRHLNQFTMSNC